MPRAKHMALALVPDHPRPGDPLAAKIDDVAMRIAQALMSKDMSIHEQIDGLKALSAYYQATRGKSAAAAAPRNAFAEYRNAQGHE